MTSDASAFPGSRSLATWWKQLAVLAPRRVWLAHLLLHHVDAPVRARKNQPLDPLALTVLRALESAPVEFTAIARPLPFDGALVGRVLGHLADLGLAQRAGASAWLLSRSGEDARASGVYGAVHEQRRVFHFLDSGARAPPRFVALRADSAPSPAIDPERWRFDVAWLQECVNRSADWKQQHGFPHDVESIVELADAASNDLPGRWRRMMVDRPEHLLALMALTTGADCNENLRAFAVRPEGWLLDSARPLVELGDWRETFPFLADDPPEEMWRRAWTAWGVSSGLPGVELAACKLHWQGCKLQVAAPVRLVERLRLNRREALERKAWVLAGEGPLRSAAWLSIVAGDS
jgi:hypothetical protein